MTSVCENFERDLSTMDSEIDVVGSDDDNDDDEDTMSTSSSSLSTRDVIASDSVKSAYPFKHLATGDINGLNTGLRPPTGVEERFDFHRLPHLLASRQTPQLHLPSPPSPRFSLQTKSPSDNLSIFNVLRMSAERGMFVPPHMAVTFPFRDLSASYGSSRKVPSPYGLLSPSCSEDSLSPQNLSNTALMNPHKFSTPCRPADGLYGKPLPWLHELASYAGPSPRDKPGEKRAAEPPRYQCEDCKKSYATFSGLSKHRQFHCESHVKKEFNCKYCDKTYNSLGALKMHIRTHTLPCKCQICGKAFSRPWLLQGHLRTHTGEKPFVCPHCGRAFADRSNLRAHLQTHSEVKKYSCKGCGKTFSRMSLLVKHSEASCSSKY